MRHDPASYLFDILAATDLLESFVAERNFDEYLANPLMRAGVERELITIGEAISQLLRRDATYADRITNATRIVGFRNILVHGYAIIRDQTVWEIVQEGLPALRSEVGELLQQCGDPL